MGIGTPQPPSVAVLALGDHVAAVIILSPLSIHYVQHANPGDQPGICFFGVLLMTMT